MDRYQSLKKELIRIKQDISAMILVAKSILGVSHEFFKRWEEMFDAFDGEISKDIIRIAVVGPIKSGKSTFINALFQRDYLKRGAGVVTSIVTRIRSSQSLQAKLFFKSWQDVNTDVEQALVLLPSSSWHAENRKFDIRNRRDRIELKQALNNLSPEQVITNDSRNANSVLLMSYLKGYDQIKGIVSSENIVRVFKSEQFAEHRSFVGNDSLSVYLRDIQLEVDNVNMESIVEIADCQGSDSSNPLHLAMIQDYLLLTHFIIYVISSRTGLRQADIKFLSMIKRIGIIENILFIINCDISEHESIDDLNTLIVKITEELSLIISNPIVYTFSSLYNLFKAQKNSLPLKDQQRMNQWRGQNEIVAFSDSETQRFRFFFDEKLSKEKSFLLLKNHLERLDVVIQGMENWLHIHRDILFREEDSIKEVLEKMRLHLEKINQIKTVIKNTLDGAVPKIKVGLKKEIDRFFDISISSPVKGVIDFIRNSPITSIKYKETLKTSGFNNTLYLIFQEFKYQLDSVISDRTNPEIIHFIKSLEKKIGQYLEEVVNPYILMIQDNLREYKRAMATVGIELTPKIAVAIHLNDMDFIKSIAGIKLPPVTASLGYTARIRSEAILRLGFYSIVKIFKRILKKNIQSSNEEEIYALNHSIWRIKRETEKSIIVHFKDYRENIKFQYIDKLIEAGANRLYYELIEHVKSYSSNLAMSIGMINNQQIDKNRVSEMMQSMETSVKHINDRISVLREKLI